MLLGGSGERQESTRQCSVHSSLRLVFTCSYSLGPHRVTGISPLSQLNSLQQGAYEGQHMPQHPGWQWVAAMSTEMGHERSEGSAVGRAERLLLWGKQRTTVVVAQSAKAGQLLGEGLVYVLPMSRDTAGRS